jgi:hypothetical protein
MIALGLFLAFFGNKFLNVVIGLVGFLATAVVLILGSFWVLQKAN